MTRYRLELEVDLDLNEEQIAMVETYRKSGLNAFQAWRQVAQDVLGPTGALVQHADLNSGSGPLR